MSVFSLRVLYDQPLLTRRVGLIVVDVQNVATDTGGKQGAEPGPTTTHRSLNLVRREVHPRGRYSARSNSCFFPNFQCARIRVVRPTHLPVPSTARRRVRRIHIQTRRPVRMAVWTSRGSRGSRGSPATKIPPTLAITGSGRGRRSTPGGIRGAVHPRDRVSG